MKRILITGITGFAGSHLAEFFLSQKNTSVFGTYLTEQSLRNVTHIQSLLHLTQVDLQDGKKVNTLIDSVRPDYVFHLAALPSTGDSFKDPVHTLVQNVTVQVNLLEALRKSDFTKTRILIVTSANVYGLVTEEDLPIDEKTSFRPTNPYAVSKITQDFLGLQYYLAYGLSLIRVRPFNHIGPRQAPYTAIASFAKRIAEIEKGKLEPRVGVGNLDSIRDTTDVRDMVKAYAQIIEKGVIGEVYNIGSGKGYLTQDLLDILLTLSSKKIEIYRDESLYRPVDIPSLICDNTKICSLIDWTPQIPIEQTLQETLEYWRNIT